MCSHCETTGSDGTGGTGGTPPGAPTSLTGWRGWIAWPFWLIGWLLILPVRLYQLAIRPLLPPLCRYRPGCSTFMIEAIQQKGPLFGLPLGVLRLMRCQPLGSYGFDPVEGWPPYRVNGRLRWRITTSERDAIMAAAHTALCEKLAAARDHDGLAMIGGWAWIPEDATNLRTLKPTVNAVNEPKQTPPPTS